MFKKGDKIYAEVAGETDATGCLAIVGPGGTYYINKNAFFPGCEAAADPHAALKHDVVTKALAWHNCAATCAEVAAERHARTDAWLAATESLGSALHELAAAVKALDAAQTPADPVAELWRLRKNLFAAADNNARKHLLNEMSKHLHALGQMQKEQSA